MTKKEQKMMRAEERKRIRDEDEKNGLFESDAQDLLKNWLKNDGWSFETSEGHEHGIDILASKNGQKWIIEVKGCASRPAMRNNYFVSVLGEELQRMDDDKAMYSIAFPKLSKFERLWNELPALAKTRTHISALFVSKDGTIEQK